MFDLKFLKTSLKDYRVAAFTPTSRRVIQKIVRELEPQHEFIVEYGPGNGVATTALLARLPTHGKLVAIELNKDFYNDLKTIDDPRLRVIHGNVTEVVKQLTALGLPRIDVVVSSIPFSFLRPPAWQAIILDTYKALAKNGIFVVYQHSPLVYSELKRVFQEVRLIFEPFDVFPKFIMVAVKR